MAGAVAQFGRQPSAAAIRLRDGSLRMLGAAPNTQGSLAKDVNDSGEAVGWTARVVDGTFQNVAMFWDSSGCAKEITSSSSGTCEARAINTAGVAVGAVSTPHGQRAFSWDSRSGVAELPLLAGTDWAEAFGINDLGYVVGRSGNHAVEWTSEGEVIDLSDTLGDGTAYGINNAGQVVGQLNGQAVTWSAEHLVSALSLEGSNSSTAYSINDLGVIVGELAYQDIGSRAVLWQPVPEPSSLLALLGGILGACAMIRRRAR